MSPDAGFFARKTPVNVWQTGSARTRWGSLSAPQTPIAAQREQAGKTGGQQREGKGEMNEEEEGEGKVKGKGRERESRDGVGAPRSKF